MEYRGGRRQKGRYVKLKLQKIASFIVVVSLDVPPEHTCFHPACRLDTSKVSVDKAFFITPCQELKIRPVTPDGRVEADWLKLRRATNLNYFVGQPISNRSHYSRTPPSSSRTSRAQGRN
jgi:hypothetical protein